MHVWQLMWPTASGAGSKKLRFNMKQKLRTLTFALALLKSRLDFFHEGLKGDGKVKTQGTASISSQINYLTTPQFAMCVVLKMLSLQSHERA